jgi:hypothetical protein
VRSPLILQRESDAFPAKASPTKCIASSLYHEAISLLTAFHCVHAVFSRTGFSREEAGAFTIDFAARI